jgi:hypothetical protein
MIMLRTMGDLWIDVSRAKREACERTGQYLDHRSRDGLHQVIRRAFDGKGGVTREVVVTGRWVNIQRLAREYDSITKPEEAQHE